MRITVRLIASLAAAAAVVVLAFSAIYGRQASVQLRQHLAEQSGLLAESLRRAVEPLPGSQQLDALPRLAYQFGDRDNLAGIAVYAPDGRPLVLSKNLPELFRRRPDIARKALDVGRDHGMFVEQDERKWYAHAAPIRLQQGTVVLLLVHDARPLEAEASRAGWQAAGRLALHALLLVLLTLVIIRWSVVGPISRTLEWMRRVRMGEVPSHREVPKGVFAPLAREVSHMAKSLVAAREAAEEEARLRLAGQSRWTPDRLKEHTRTVLEGRSLVVVSNREPYMHVRGPDQKIRCVVPPSGLVTAMEPVLRACGGTWIAQASGDADRQTADLQGRLRVPPDAPLYTLRRVWLTKEEEAGYYYGFSNEGLWPLCHIAHTRPIFRAEDWTQYRRVNAAFAQAICEELEGTSQPYVLIQDYHFALLPRMIKEARPDARIALFWHIPWPNPEAFGICPWARELLDGMLGADLLGFHIQFHCNNFLDTADRTLESRIDWEQLAVNRGDHTTWIKPFPISIAVPEEPLRPDTDAAALKERLSKSLGMRLQTLGIGVDRIDYTKGILERFRALERLFERHPEWRERFTFVQIGAPSRTLIKRYQDLGAELEVEAQRINQRFHTRSWRPIVLLNKQHSHEEITPYYRAADVCLVTALHDGMNLVAKEFVAARSDQRGVLILSQFAGASRELRDALLVNPYDLDQVSEAIAYALQMDPEEQRARMSRMRELLQEHNVYRWAANLVTELAQLRTDAPSLQSLTGHEPASPLA